MKKELEKKVYELNLALNNPVVPWTPEKGCLDTYISSVLDSCGCQHTFVAQEFPELAKYIK